MGKETIEEGSGVGIILVSPDEKMHSYAIRLKFNTSDHAIDCDALLAGLAASVSKGVKDLHVFMDSPKLVAQTKGNHTPATGQERNYKREIMDATALFHRVGNHKVGISQSGSIGSYQNKTIGGGDKQQQAMYQHMVEGGDTMIPSFRTSNSNEQQHRGENMYQLMRKEIQATCNVYEHSDEVWSHHQNSGEAGVSKDISGSELLAPS
ncbi:reverse transcriptase domain-containing protein [Tanacetum coccineum]